MSSFTSTLDNFATGTPDTVSSFATTTTSNSLKFSNAAPSTSIVEVTSVVTRTPTENDSVAAVIVTTFYSTQPEVTVTPSASALTASSTTAASISRSPLSTSEPNATTLDPGLIAGISMGSVAFFALLCCGIWWFMARTRRHKISRSPSITENLAEQKMAPTTGSIGDEVSRNSPCRSKERPIATKRSQADTPHESDNSKDANNLGMQELADHNTNAIVASSQSEHSGDIYALQHMSLPVKPCDNQRIDEQGPAVEMCTSERSNARESERQMQPHSHLGEQEYLVPAW